MAKRVSQAPIPLMQRITDNYSRLLVSWAWVLPVGVGLLGLASSITTQVFLPLWGGIAVFAALGMLTLVIVGKVHIRAGWVAAAVLTPFIGQVGVMSYTLLMLSAGAYTALFVIYVILATLARTTRHKTAPASSVSS